jgi:mitochondrial import receptor subunit TOM70
MNSAFKMLEKAIEVDDKCEFAYETLGTVEVQRGIILLRFYNIQILID